MREGRQKGIRHCCCCGMMDRKSRLEERRDELKWELRAVERELENL